MLKYFTHAKCIHHKLRCCGFEGFPQGKPFHWIFTIMSTETWKMYVVSCKIYKKWLIVFTQKCKVKVKLQKSDGFITQNEYHTFL